MHTNGGYTRSSDVIVYNSCHGRPGAALYEVTSEVLHTLVLI